MVKFYNDFKNNLKEQVDQIQEHPIITDENENKLAQFADQDSG